SAASLRVIADHARATAFLVADGVMPSNEGRGYVLRKIIRRLMRHAWMLGQKRPVVLTEMVVEVQKTMCDVYPELTSSGDVVRIVHEEERRFHHTMEVGLQKLEEELTRIATEGLATTRPGQTIREEHSRFQKAFAAPEPQMGEQLILPGAVAFKLYDTFGLPIDF